MPAKRLSVSNLLLSWYDAHARDLPWRVRDGAADPYRVWLSEVMLQQTTVATVRPRFAAWVARWPDVAALAAADEADVMAAWAGLGYYARARNLVKAARAVAARGAFPRTEAELRTLPGLGDYTAAAVAAIAFGERAVVVDANVERVVARLFAIDTPLPGARPAIRAAADAITPATRAGDFAQGMMDLGATICTTRKPRCLLCPLRAECAGFAQGEPERLPVKAAKKARPQRYGTLFWLWRDTPPTARAELGEAPPLSEAQDDPSTSSGLTGGGRGSKRNSDTRELPPLPGGGRGPASGGGETEGRPPQPDAPQLGPGLRRGSGEVLLIRRPAKGLLGGMRALPTGPWTDTPPGLDGAPLDADWRIVDGRIDHGFTHFDLQLALAVAQAPAHGLPAGEWWPVTDMDAAGLPTVFAKAARLMEGLP